MIVVIPFTSGIIYYKLVIYTNGIMYRKNKRGGSEYGIFQ